MAGKQGPETRRCNDMRKRGIADYGDRLVIVKNHGSEFSRAGVSDFTGCLDGVYYAIEVKHEKNYGGSVERALRKGPTLLQRTFVQHVLDAGGCAGFAVTVDQFNEILEHAYYREYDDVKGEFLRCPGHNILEEE